ncbi:MAG: carbohydrate ABC transporter permease [Spirochaetaceae bacterium]|nr:carbohydrate ABC transporter permease [Spirochaetaceae bacterium]
MARKKFHVAFYLLGGIVAFLWLVPLIWMVLTAFTKASFVMQVFPHTGWTFGNIAYVWGQVPFGRYYLNTITIVVCTYAIQFVTITMAAYALATLHFKGEKLVFLIIFVQIIIPNDILIIPNFMTISDLGLTDTKLAIMLPFLGSAMGTFLLRQHFKTIPRALTDAAIIDGCNTAQVIRHVFVPNAKTAYISFALVSVSYHWNNFLWPLVVTNSVENRTLTVGLALFAKSKEAVLQWTNVCAATFIISAPLVVLFLVFQRQFIESFVSSGIK